ncbi:hypothetical protein CVT25_014464 [Psilocybe cyanescens]|uniref:NADH:flavin oxidoreductase/NADH oxidase N-terminal domain-containing protein n=1 Tax=Psilocybe cyanescens TaxID=93625 RepID=A0A409XRA6_PSICY|nr:hypothetical protein CVT25_014464 [Psilocybe cyanescens]
MTLDIALSVGYSPDTTHKLVELPSAPLVDVSDDLTLGHEKDGDREHNVSPRAFDKALALLFKLADPEGPVTPSGLPLPAETDEENDPGFVVDPGFATEPKPEPETPVSEIIPGVVPTLYEIDPGAETDPGVYSQWKDPEQTEEPAKHREEEVVKMVFFEYDVADFFGLGEKNILEDVANGGIIKRMIEEDDWETEEYHFSHDPHIVPQIPLTLLKLSIAHALAQSTLLARYETNAQRALSSSYSFYPQTAGRVWCPETPPPSSSQAHRPGISTSSNVLCVPELFWSEASVKCLYDAVRVYMEVGPRVQVLGKKLGMASDFLDAIRDPLNTLRWSGLRGLLFVASSSVRVQPINKVTVGVIFHAATTGMKMQALASASASALPQREETYKCLSARCGKFRALPGVPGYVTAAFNSQKSVFDGIELHGANSYIIHQFFGGTSNKRTDGWEALKVMVEVFGRNVALKSTLVEDTMT